MTRILLALAMVAVALAGCAKSEPFVTAGLITPGVWNISSERDQILIWAHNEGGAGTTIQWNITGADGARLPGGWKIAFAPPTATLEPFGTKKGTASGTVYPDWAWTVATLTMPATETAGPRNLELRAGNAIVPFLANVSTQRDATTTIGSQVTAQYRGTFTDTGEQFDAGNFPLKLGQGRAVPGFDLGLLGLRFGEGATLIVPPAMAYGYDAGGNKARFSGETLTFEVKIIAMTNPS